MKLLDAFSEEVPLSLLAFFVGSNIRTGRSMANGTGHPRMKTNELLHYAQTHSETMTGNPRSWYNLARGRRSRSNSITLRKFSILPEA